MKDQAPLGISRLSLGSDSIFSRLSFEAAVRLVETALDAGINTFDISYYRHFPHNEVVFGRVLQAIGVDREQYRLIEKVWLPQYPEVSLEQQFRLSLARLGVDHADVVLCESPRPHTDPATLARETAQLVQSGLTRNWGVVNWTADEILAASHEVEQKDLPGPKLAQLKYSIARRSIVEGTEYANALDRSGMKLHAADTLESGILAGKTSTAHPFARDSGNIRDEIRALYPKIADVAERLSATPAQVALAFCLTNDRVASVVFGATTPEQVLDNAKALDLANQKGDQILEMVADFGVSGHMMDPPMEFTEMLPPHFVA